MVIGSNILAGASGQGGTFEIEQSTRFNDDDSPYLYRSPSGAGSATTMTWSYWVKRAANFGANNWMWGSYSSPLHDSCFFNTSDQLNFSIDVGGSRLTTTRVFRDPGAWFHVVLVWDSSNGTSGDRMRMYINGERQTDFGTETYPSSGASAPRWNTTTQMEVGRSGYTGQHGDMYMAEFNFLDGIAVTDASDFGQTDSATGQWVPKKYTGSYGSNGFRLQGSDSSDLGEDTSGNGNDFTSSGLAAADQMSDSPTDNFITWNPLVNPGGGTAGTYSNGNLDFTAGGDNGRAGTIFVSSGKWYVEWEIIGSGANCMVGIVSDSVVASGDMVDDTASSGLDKYGGDRDVCSYYGITGDIFLATTDPSYGDTYANGDIIGMALDLDNGAVWFSKNGTWQNSATISEIQAGTTTNAARTGLDNNFTLHFHQFDGTSGARINAGQSAFTYTQPTGFSKLSTAALPEPSTPDPSAYFQATTYTGDGSSSNEINQTGNSTFEPSMVWIKSRSAATDHVIQDQVRGNFIIYPNQSSADGATGGGWVSSFDSDGFTVNVNGPINDSGKTFVGWQWKAAGSGSSNTDGDITSTVSANTTSGMSILTYSGNGSDNQTIGHGLGIAPKMIITKRRDSSGNWTTYHDAVGINQVFYLNSTAAPSSNTEQYRATPTSSVYTVGVGGDINNSSGTYVAYVFAEVEGFSKIGSYTGNGSADGPFVPLSFSPALIIFKNISAAGQAWEMFDNKRDGFNDANRRLYPNTSEVEPAASDRVRLTSNGFKIVTSGGTHVNGSGNTIIYYAVAESPLKFANAR
jgi:hypothetical protein